MKMSLRGFRNRPGFETLIKRVTYLEMRDLEGSVEVISPSEISDEFAPQPW